MNLLSVDSRMFSQTFLIPLAHPDKQQVTAHAQSKTESLPVLLSPDPMESLLFDRLRGQRFCAALGKGRRSPSKPHKDIRGLLPRKVMTFFFPALILSARTPRIPRTIRPRTPAGVDREGPRSPFFLLRAFPLGCCSRLPLRFFPVP